MAFHNFYRAALVAMMAMAGAASVAAQKKIPPPLDCGQGVSLRLNSATAAQGGLLEAEVRSTKPLAEIQGDWSKEQLHFWQDASHKNIERAFIAVDLERAPGRYELSLTAELVGSTRATCSAAITVKAGKFAVEKLSVAKEFVEPSAEEIERANKERQRLREIFATVTPDRWWQGKFRLPLDGARNAKNFGRRRVLNGEPGSPHSGVDFPAPPGTPIHAAQRGKVVLAEKLFFSGNTVVIDHGLGIYTFYGHMESIAVSVGDAVEKGTVLGKVGATGRVTGPHLHWGLTVNQARVNPLQILSLPTS
ncbi:MAG: M23 family metallopeptidase [Candidatus Acidiferrales bacterium]